MLILCIYELKEGTHSSWNALKTLTTLPQRLF
ncbi:hypothetical protein V462_04150 [Pantoea ananatis 15320]|nr:hypothetical protein L585_21785 [Pantoea ananatis BRT175]PKC39725.1 hypothetical protein V462_04150 [Pantoea ananatis 15320]PKC44431.1 hypothetical protein V461_08840 [Pantoea ananatis BRT98]